MKKNDEQNKKSDTGYKENPILETAINKMEIDAFLSEDNKPNEQKSNEPLSEYQKAFLKITKKDATT